MMMRFSKSGEASLRERRLLHMNGAPEQIQALQAEMANVKAENAELRVQQERMQEKMRELTSNRDVVREQQQALVQTRETAERFSYPRLERGRATQRGLRGFPIARDGRVLQYGQRRMERRYGMERAPGFPLAVARGKVRERGYSRYERPPRSAPQNGQIRTRYRSGYGMYKESFDASKNAWVEGELMYDIAEARRRANEAAVVLRGEALSDARGREKGMRTSLSADIFNDWDRNRDRDRTRGMLQRARVQREMDRDGRTPGADFSRFRESVPGRVPDAPGATLFALPTESEREKSIRMQGTPEHRDFVEVLRVAGFPVEAMGDRELAIKEQVELLDSLIYSVRDARTNVSLAVVHFDRNDQPYAVLLHDNIRRVLALVRQDQKKEGETVSSS